MNLYICNISENISEGGMARNNAFYQNFRNKRDFIILNAYGKNIFQRISRCITISFRLIFVKKKVIFIHQNTLLYLYPIWILDTKLIAKIYQYFISQLTTHNQIYIEINDLPYEQSIDLGLTQNSTYLKFQSIIFSLSKAKYVFAAIGLKEYSVEKYFLNPINCFVVPNGAHTLEKNLKFKKFKWEKSKKINCIYSGSLNIGRGIPQLIEAFRKIENSNLILIGSHGEWIKEISDIPKNVYYEGDFPEAKAQFVTSHCDLGVIHYDTSKKYYNLCFPTKASFYLESGLRVISTPLVELVRHFSNSDFFIFSEIEAWENIISRISKNECKLRGYHHTYSWGELLKNIDYQ